MKKNIVNTSSKTIKQNLKSSGKKNIGKSNQMITFSRMFYWSRTENNGYWSAFHSVTSMEIMSISLQCQFTKKKIIAIRGLWYPQSRNL